jgi:hypothetical protein
MYLRQNSAGFSRPAVYELKSIATNTNILRYKVLVGNFSTRKVNFRIKRVLQIMVPWDVALCNLADIYRHFRETCCLHL